MATLSTESLRQFVLSPGDKPRWYPTLNIFGDLITPIITGRETAGGLVILEGVTRPKGGPPRHVHHREDESFYVTEGRYLFEYGDTRVEGGPGTYVFLPRDIPHCFQNISETAGRMMTICQPAGLEQFFEEVSKLQGPPDPARIGPVAEKWGLEILGPPMAMR
jgi:mannose-6-phosphate isomerase-like protein (cupin superfamily)